MCFNTTTPYNNGTYGTAPITLNAGNMYIKCINDFNDGTTGYDTAMFLESSNASAPVAFAFQLSTGANTTSSNAACIGTTTNNDLRFITNNGLKMTLTSTGRVGIGTSSPVYPLHVAGTNATYSIGAATLSAFFSGSILVKTGVYAESDRRRKIDINPINITLEHYDKLNPVSYRYKEENNFKLGLIARMRCKYRRS
ncbi:Intramolecular chaperone auto-processing domain [Phytophthora cactorum]|nr:Intramolecular chaperone auto-processing domain [Phytophthora cactorum]